MPPAGCIASGKAEKNAGGESSLSLAAFFCFHSARGDAWFVSSSFVRKAFVFLAKLFANRSPEEELLWRGGTGAAEAPASSSSKLHAEIIAFSHLVEKINICAQRLNDIPSSSARRVYILLPSSTYLSLS